MPINGLVFIKFVKTELRETNMEDHEIMFITPLEEPYVEYAAVYYAGEKLLGMSEPDPCPLTAAAAALEQASKRTAPAGRSRLVVLPDV